MCILSLEYHASSDGAESGSVKVKEFCLSGLKYGIRQADASFGVMTLNDVAHPEQLSGSVSMNGCAETGNSIEIKVSAFMKYFPSVISLHKS